MDSKRLNSAVASLAISMAGFIFSGEADKPEADAPGIADTAAALLSHFDEEQIQGLHAPAELEGGGSTPVVVGTFARMP